MGGRNAYSASSKSIVSKQYHTIGTDGKMTFIQSHVDRPKDPVRSNSPNPIYVVVSKEGEIENIYFYKNHKVIKSIDFDDEKGPHGHTWKTVLVKRKNREYYSSERAFPNTEHLKLTRKENLYVKHAKEFLRNFYKKQ